ncbi:hypothetical protein BV20DRAFT_601484 [Pilatotrama ljubarskyi]|nr:hypothetical protein BV20DRAFT_601484 [Pilatotrama ljubarskyi]
MPQSSTESVQAFVNDVAPVNAEGQVLCYHGIPARRLTSHTAANPGRDFYCCSKNSGDPDRCKFFSWADNPTLESAVKSRREQLNMPPTTPQRPSQAQRALFSRSPTVAAASLQKRPRPTSPIPSSGSAIDPVGAVKHRRVDSAVYHFGEPSGLTPSTTASQWTERVPDSERATQDAKRAARMKSIEDALLAVQTTPRDPSPASSSGFPRRREDVQGIQGASQTSPIHSHSDVPLRATPPALSQNIPMSQNFPRFSQDAMSDAGTCIDTEIELAEMEDMESKAVQTSPVDDEDSIIEDFWSLSPPRSVIGSPVAVADVGAGTSRKPQDRPPTMPQRSAAEPTAWSSGPPHTPGRGGSSREFTPGVNEGRSNPSMLLTPPGSSQPQHGSEAGAGRSTTQRGRALLQEMLASPTASKGRGPELSASASTSQRWQMLQDDLENPFRASVVAHTAVSPAPTAISAADSVYGDTPAGAHPADSIASHLAALQSVPEYIAKLERREKAARKSAEVRGRKIAQLEEEVQRLRREKRALEETVAAIQMRR